MMHSVKGGWMQTFALAKQNESEGKKSRIRRSKEERKAMVESFIKKYQESNSGNFPSLNLTHKEVGGSFYTVREIVRDIIQENRVLGPAKFNLEELNTDEFFEQNPLGSIARGPHFFLAASSNENHLECNNVTDANGKMLSVSDKHYIEAEHQVVDNVINVGHLHVTNKEPAEATVVSDGCYSRSQDPVVDKGSVVNGSQVDGTNNGLVEAPVVFDGYITGAESEIIDKGNDNGHVINVDHVHVTNKEPNGATVVSDGYYTVDQDPVVDKGYVVSSSQVDVTSNESVEAHVVSDGCIIGTESAMIDQGLGINGSQVDMAGKESNEASISDMLASKPKAPEQNVEQELVASTMPQAKVNFLTEDLIVETFPLRSVATTDKGIEGLEGLSESSNYLEKDIKILDLEEGKKSESFGSEPTKNYNLVDGKLEDFLGNKKLNEISSTGHDKENNLGVTIAESANYSTHKDHLGHEYEVRASRQNAITSETNSQSQIKDGAKTSNQDDFQAKNISKSYPEGSKLSDKGLHEADKHRVDRRLVDNFQRRCNKTVDRINLESWDGRSKNSAKQEPNPLFALFKAVANALAKFWSE